MLDEEVIDFPGVLSYDITILPFSLDGRVCMRVTSCDITYLKKKS